MQLLKKTILWSLASHFFLIFPAAASPVKLHSLSDLLKTAVSHVEAKRFPQAEQAYREAVERAPASREARLGLARVILWQQRYEQARREFLKLLSIDLRDTDARVGLANAYYWAGDYRNARREFLQVLRERPADLVAARSLSEIASASRPGFIVETGSLADDQPYESLTAQATAFFFSDPLTKWHAGGGTSRLESDHRTGPGERISGSTAFVRGGVDTSITPRLHLHFSASLLGFPDETTAFLPHLSLTVPLGAAKLKLTAERRELLRSAPALRNHPSVDTIAIRWSHEDPERLQWSLGAAELRYFDENRGAAIDGFLLIPVRWSKRGVSLAGGTSFSYRDTDQSRFNLLHSSATSSGNGLYRYHYDGVYDPYWSPQRMNEARLIGAANNTRGRVTFGVHIDGGIARDTAVSFGPRTGTSPQAPTGLQSTFERTYYPWRARLHGSYLLSSGMTVALSAERTSTVFYEANEITASLAGRF